MTVRVRMAKYYETQGFKSVLSSGLTVRVGWQWGANCTVNRDGTPETVEVTCWLTKTGEWMAPKVWNSDDDVIGHVPVGDVVKFINIALNWKN